MNLYPIVKLLLTEMTKGSTMYKYRGSLWLIFTEERDWVFEYRDNILWYNHTFFTNVFKYISKDVLDHHELIREWFIDLFNDECDVLPLYGQRYNISDIFDIHADYYNHSGRIGGLVKKVTFREVTNHPSYLNHLLD